MQKSLSMGGCKKFIRMQRESVGETDEVIKQRGRKGDKSHAKMRTYKKSPFETAGVATVSRLPPLPYPHHGFFLLLRATG